MDEMRKYVKICIILSIILVWILSLGSCNKDEVNLGHHFKFDTKRQCVFSHQIGVLYPIVIKNQPGRRDIPPNVIDYVFDKRYVLVKQQPKIPLEQIYYDSNDVAYPHELDSLYYWIIIKRDGIVLGPMLFDDFHNKCNELGISLSFEPQ